MHTKSLQSRPTLYDAMDCSPPGSSVHGILQARILEWVVMPSSRGFSRPRDGTAFPVSPALQEDSFPLINRGCHGGSLVSTSALQTESCLWALFNTTRAP